MIDCSFTFYFHLFLNKLKIKLKVFLFCRLHNNIVYVQYSGRLAAEMTMMKYKIINTQKFGCLWGLNPINPKHPVFTHQTLNPPRWIAHLYWPVIYFKNSMNYKLKYECSNFKFPSIFLYCKQFVSCCVSMKKFK